MEELLWELLEGDWDMEIIEGWQPVQQDDMSWWRRFWLTGNTGL